MGFLRICLSGRATLLTKAYGLCVCNIINRTMKTIFLCVAFLCSLTLYSQDMAQVKRIDSLVSMINISDYKIQRDTIKQDRPEMGLSMRTYLTIVSSGSE